MSNAERRRSKRLAVLDTFSLFVVLPAKGPLRLKVNDVSLDGIGFELDIAEEQGSRSFTVSVDSLHDIQLYLNQSLYLPLTVQVRRITEEQGLRRLGTELRSHSSKGHSAFTAFVQMLDALSEGARIEAS